MAAIVSTDGSKKKDGNEMKAENAEDGKHMPSAMCPTISSNYVPL
jgi:hypothetical protein